jgi:hypothetical protein
VFLGWDRETLMENVGPPPSDPFAAEGGNLLFNGRDLSGWSTFIPAGPSDDPHLDPGRIFRVEGGMIHITGERFGTLTTRDEYADYHLSLQFRWGRKRWPPREKVVRDSGVLLHCTGPEKIWPRCIECQIQEHDCGDFWAVDGATLEVDGQHIAIFAKKKVDAERPTGEWNTVEVVCEGDTITNIINGVVVNRGTRASVTRGKIALQSEGAEVFFANVRLRPLR